jgi:hypothetical protein
MKARVVNDLMTWKNLLIAMAELAGAFAAVYFAGRIPGP